jgi:putative molybdopterin biosynthesis protein
VIGVPGYPLAAAVIFELFAVPLLGALQGIRPADRARLRARLACDWTSPADVEEWVTMSVEVAANGPVLATPFGHGAGATSRLARADAWWRVPVGQGQFSQGTEIEIRPVSRSA